MKTLYIFAISVLLISCKSETKPSNSTSSHDETAIAISGEELFSGKGTCTACHLPDQKVIGPSIIEIAKIYKEQNASIVAFLKEEGKPIVDPSQYEVMKTNFAITKKMTDEELKALEDYMLSFAK
jgi:cytochrome c